VPPGTGTRLGIDRDGDGRRDRDELDAGTDPADPTSFAGAPELLTIEASALSMRDAGAGPADPSRRRISFRASTASQLAANRIVVPPRGSGGDPTLAGARLRVYNANGSGEQATVDLPATQWSASGSGYTFRGSGAVTTVRVRADRLTVRGGKALWPYTLDEPSQGRIAVRLTLGDGVDWCAEAVVAIGGDDDRSGRFRVKRSAAPIACPVPPLGSPSGAFVDSL
jgi:hypothetical protein